jgi:hypothetical protein
MRFLVHGLFGYGNPGGTNFSYTKNLTNFVSSENLDDVIRREQFFSESLLREGRLDMMQD